MKKNKTYIIFLVLFAILFVQISKEHHNHSPLEKETSSCPAYILQSQFFSITIADEPVNTAHCVIYHFVWVNHDIPVLTSFASSPSKRAPPAKNI